MNKKRSGMLLIAFGVIAALAVAFTVFRVTRQATAQKVETIDVLVALQDIPERTVLTPALVGVRPAIPDALPPGVLTKPDQVTGRMTTTRLYSGEMILPGRLADTSGRSGVSFNLTKGKVLITLPASDIIGTAAVRPGDHVDLLVTIFSNELPTSPAQAGATSQGGASQASAAGRAAPDLTVPMVTQTTMQNLVVVGIGPFGVVSKDTQAPSSAGAAGTASASLLTFALSHDDALRLKALKDTRGVRMELVLRAAGDEEIVQTEPVTLQTLLQFYRIKTQ